MKHFVESTCEEIGILEIAKHGKVEKGGKGNNPFFASICF
jgi:hypothetical protein